MLVITDGVDTSSALTAPQVSAVASSIDVPVYIIAAVPAVDQRALEEAIARDPEGEAARLRNLAEWTGGRFEFVGAPAETARMAGVLVEELRQQYVLAIEAAGTPEWRRLDVRVKRASVLVRARSGYYGGS